MVLWLLSRHPHHQRDQGSGDKWALAGRVEPRVSHLPGGSLHLGGAHSSAALSGGGRCHLCGGDGDVHWPPLHTSSVACRRVPESWPPTTSSATLAPAGESPAA